MKILDKTQVPWHGIKVTCEICHTQLELEGTDQPTVEFIGSSVNQILRFRCEACSHPFSITFLDGKEFKK